MRDLTHHSLTNPSASDDKAYIGERKDPAAGLIYLNARYYDPDLALFTQPDWFEVTTLGVGTNRYSYSFNDPVNLSDPNGNIAPAVVAAGIFLGGLILGEITSDQVNDGKIDGDGLIGSAIQNGAALVESSVFDDKKEKEEEEERAQQSNSEEKRPGKDPNEEPPKPDLIPETWTERKGKPSKNPRSTIYEDPNNPKGNRVRVDAGNPNVTNVTQRIDHVVVHSNGRVIGRDGQPIPGNIKENYEQAHIPLDEYNTWSSWNKP